MNHIKSVQHGVIFITFFIFSDLFATEFHSHEAIKKSVYEFVELSIDQKKPYEIEVGSIDSRLKLAKCDRPLETSNPVGQRSSGRVTVGVKCKGSQPWSLYIPATVKIFEQVLVTTRPLPTGSMISLDHVTLVKKEISRLRQGYFTVAKEVEGSFVKRPLINGAILTASNIRPPNIAERGERVIILAKGSGVVVRMQGIIMNDAVAGSRVRVKNLLSNRIIEGRIYKKGVVEVAM